MHDVAVVGTGIFGSVIATHLRRGGLSVVTIGDDRPLTGSAAAGCIMKPSWVSSLSRDQYDDGITLLDALYGVRTVQFKLQPGGRVVACHRVDPPLILRPSDPAPHYRGRVTGVDATMDLGAVAFTDAQECQNAVTARRVIVAAGVWTPELCPWVATYARYGWSFRGPPVPVPTISMWAPYRQVVALNLDDYRSWSGDGSALIEKSATRVNREKAEARVAKATGLGIQSLEHTLGIRPYAETGGKPCLVSRRGSVWAVTGGAKNGTIAAAWAAREIEREMRL